MESGWLRTICLMRCSMVFCLGVIPFSANQALAAESSNKHSLEARYQDFEDDTTVSQSFSAAGLLYRYEFYALLGVDLEYFRLSDDLQGNLYRVGLSGSVPLGRVKLNYGGTYYQQELNNFPGDSEDSGFKLMAGLSYDFRHFSLDLNYISEDVEGANPDDPGDYIELDRIEFNVRHFFSGTPWSVEYKYISSGSDYSANALALSYSFGERSFEK
jgi:hypothetical protein